MDFFSFKLNYFKNAELFLDGGSAKDSSIIVFVLGY